MILQTRFGTNEGKSRIVRSRTKEYDIPEWQLLVNQNPAKEILLLLYIGPEKMEEINHHLQKK
jgi:hypothetical protein